MYSINDDKEPKKLSGPTSTKPSSTSPPKRRSFLRRRWVKVSCFMTALTLFAFYFFYYYYYQHHHQAVSALNTLITSVTQINSSDDKQQQGRRDQHFRLEHEYLTPPDFIHDQHLPLDTWAPQQQTRGALYMIVRNENLPDARAAMRAIQDRFNDQAKYPWILLNDQYFNAEFKRHISSIVAGKNISLSFGKIDTDAWNYPWWIDVPRAENAFEEDDHLSYYEHLRYQAGMFFHHPLFSNVEYAWRVDPGVLYTCTIDDDPFSIMKNEKKKIGFVLTTKKDQSAFRTLWPTTINFMQKYSQWIKPINQTIMPWVTQNDNRQYWYMQSSFEIIDLSFLRSEAYQAYFNYLDLTGGFFYERWDDSTRTLAAAMFLNKNQIHFFDKIGYSKDDISHCPFQSSYLQKCTCDLAKSHDISENSGTLDLLKYVAPTTFDSVINFAQSKIPHNIKIDLNNTHVLKQVIKEKDQLSSFFKK